MFNDHETIPKTLQKTSLCESEMKDVQQQIVVLNTGYY